MRRLVQYITSTQGTKSRVGEVTITNCHADNPTDAAIEMELIQSMNKRSNADKTYHLLVSFRAGEEPDEKTMREIEKQLCASLGYSEHQRIAVVHRDTDNTHMHIAINKVHPETHSVNQPYFDFYKLRRARKKLEEQFSLCIDTKEATDEDEQQTGSAKAQDMEAYSAIESLESWIRRECMEDITKAKSWEDLHRTLAENGLSIVKRGNGLVFQTVDGGSTPVKASSIDRLFSKKNIEEKFGEFVAPSKSIATVAIRRQYDKALVSSIAPEAVTLFDEYKRARNANENRQANELAALNKEYARRAAAAKELNKAETKAIRIGKWSTAKKLQLDAQKLKHSKRMAELRQENREKRMKVYVDCGRCTWLDWLRNQAESGREDAVVALRARAHTLNKKINPPSITGKDKAGDAPILEKAHIDKVTKKGTVMYQVGDEIVRHDVDGYTVTKSASLDTTIMALQMAQKRFGNNLTITGGLEFKATVIAAAVDARMNITFTDKRMEEERKRLLTARKEEQKKQEREQGKEGMNR